MSLSISQMRKLALREVKWRPFDLAKTGLPHWTNPGLRFLTYSSFWYKHVTLE